MRIILADDHAIFRDGLKLLLQSREGYEIAAEVAHLEQLKNALRQQADLLILDYHMPGGDAAGLLAYCKTRHLALKVVALTGAQSAQILKQLVDANADAVLLKEGSSAELLTAIERVMQGKRYLSEAVKQAVAAVELPPLSARELEVFKLIFLGYVTREIADKLALSPKTVDKHRENIMRKLQVNNLAGLINAAHRLQLFGNADR